LIDRFDPARGEIAVAAADFAGPNGLAFSPDETRLYVAETGDQTRPDPEQVIRVFDVGPNNALSGGGLFHKITPGYCDGMKVDEDGNVWSSAADGVHCLSPDGALLGKIRVPYRVSNLAFGGLHRNRLFIGGSHTLYSIFLDRRGVPLP
jgi:gluconolactonase